MEPTIKPGKNKAGTVGNDNFQKSSATLLLPPSGTEGGKLGTTLFGDAVSSRGKVPLKPGRSLLHWMKLGRSGQDLSGTNGKLLQITPKQLALHNKEDDAWIVLRGKVYNITPYMEYHPGGIPELMRGAGIDGTALFNEVHKWVNYESMLACCFIGNYVPSVSSTPVHSDRKNSTDNVKLLASTNDLRKPRYSWFHGETTITVSVHVENEAVEKENVIIDKTSTSLHLRLLMGDHVYHVEQDLSEAVGDFEVVTGKTVGKVDVLLQKEKPEREWRTLGIDGTRNNLWNKFSDEDMTYRVCSVNSISSVTHDTRLFCIEYRRGVHMAVPVGKHVFVRMRSGDGPVCREYTVVPPSLLPEKADKRTSMGQVLYLMIKTYATGLLTPAISTLVPGDTVDVGVMYAGNFKLSQLNGVTHLIMYAAGTGFTPMASLIQHCIAHPEALSLSHIQLVFFNRQERDILWKEELDQLCSNHERFKVVHCLSEPGPQWTGLTGHVSPELMKSVSPKPDIGPKPDVSPTKTDISPKPDISPTKPDVSSIPDINLIKPDNTSGILLCVCGPVQFTQKVVRFAGELGYTDDMIFPFSS